ncbi:hypothetical protein [Pseudonocardia acidicola]|uniref:Uncharacterized protein n=1 Tax=Pseudonocardia acidicola TaxID=2724939 RepID=A0ABX1SJP3_9PSEU|nr:hypothetical protein [Pseudonocardia acidicola]NMI00729.1 hypothetical protein [Pseudonocardia acidicola]
MAHSADDLLRLAIESGDHSAVTAALVVAAMDRQWSEGGQVDPAEVLASAMNHNR